MHVFLMEYYGNKMDSEVQHLLWFMCDTRWRSSSIAHTLSFVHLPAALGFWRGYSELI